MNSTRYASLKRAPALLILGGTVSLAILCIAQSPRGAMTPQVAPRGEVSDVDIYKRVVQRVHEGEGYYRVLGSELRSNNRPTKAIANWRTPLHLGSLAAFPSPAWLRILLIGLAATAVVLALVMMGHAGAAPPALAMTQGVLMAGALLACFVEPGTFLVEAWSGLMIVLSIEAYAFGWRKPAVVAGLLALFLRELALPYVLISALLSFREKLWKELLVWVLGLAAYCAYFGAHAAMVSSLILPGDAANAVGWVQFGGIPVLLRTSAIWALVALPAWAAALYLPAALLGLGGWKSPVAVRASATVLTYLAAFAVVGHPANSYWGAMYSPVLAFGAAWSIPAIRDLTKAALPDKTAFANWFQSASAGRDTLAPKPR